MDSFRRLILPGFLRIGVNGRRPFGRRSVTTLRVSFPPFEDLRAGLRVSLPSIFLGVVSQPFEGLRAVSLSNRSNHSRILIASDRFMAQTALKPHLILDDDNSLD